METKPPRNGKADPGPMFAVISTDFVVVPAHIVLEMLERNAQTQAKTNLALGPIFRNVADAFRDWSKIAEPGCLFQAPEIGMWVIRLVSCAPLATALSEAAQAKIQEEQEAVNPRITMP